MSKINFPNSLLFMLVIFFFSACEDVVDINVDGAAGDLVIDAWIDNRPQTQTIRLTISQNYFDNTSAEGVSNAEILIENNTVNQVFNFTETIESGTYQWTPNGNEMIGSEGDEVTLNINYNSETYTATTTIARGTTIDSIDQRFVENDLILEDGIFLQFFAKDRLGVGDAYRIKTFVNDTLLNSPIDLNIASDAGIDAASSLDGIAFIEPIREYIHRKEQGDEENTPYIGGENVRVEIHSLNQDAFEFLRIARGQINNDNNGIFSLPLTSPRSNIFKQSDGKRAFGIFNIAQVSGLDYTVLPE